MIKAIKILLVSLFIIFVMFVNISCEKQNIEQIVNKPNNLYALVKDIKTIDSTRAILQEKFYYELAKEAGKQDTIDWKILYSIWMVESKMDPSVKGDGGKAHGQGQIHMSAAKQYYNSKITEKELSDPIINGFACSKIVKAHMKTFNNNDLYAVAAYNAGPVPIKEDYKNSKAPRNWQYVNKYYQFKFSLK